MTKRKRYEVVRWGADLTKRSLGRYASITSALVRAYKYTRRVPGTLSITRDGQWLADVHGA